jgi:hypothetical protein
VAQVRRRRGALPLLKIFAGAALALVLVVAAILSVNRYRKPASAPPEALEKIAQKNREAATIAAASQRAESAASTNAAEDLAEARRRGSDRANAMLDRFENEDDRGARPGNSS